MEPDRYDDHDSYINRLCSHLAILVANEDTSIVLGEDRLMLAVVFVRHHCDMVLGELHRPSED